MATRVSVPNSTTTNLESFACIWLDQDLHTKKDNQETLHQLRSVFNHLQVFDDYEECEACIRRIQTEDVVLIVSGQCGQKIMPSINKLPQFIACYVFCRDLEGNKEWSSKYPKIKGVFHERSHLINALTAAQKVSIKMEEGGSISIISGGSESLKARNAMFMWFQLFIEVLLRMHHKTSDRKELIDLCKKTYDTNDEEMKIILEFEETHKSDNAIWWYTPEPETKRSLVEARLNLEKVGRGEASRGESLPKRIEAI